MQLVELVRTSRDVAETSARSKKIERVAALLARTPPEEVPAAVAYLSGDTGGPKLNVGYSGIAAIVAAAASSPTLTLGDVQTALARIAGCKGSGSNRERQRLLQELFGKATAEEQSFLQRLIVGELRQGALEGVMHEAIASAWTVPASSVRRAAMLTGDLVSVARTAATEGDRGLDAFRIEPFRPLQSMLAQSANTLDDALEASEGTSLEYKLDGARIQVHRVGDDVRVFTRRLNDATARVPEIVEAVRALPAQRLVLDGEAIALRADGTPQPFQVSMRRFSRSVGVPEARDRMPLRSFFFDCIHLDGEDLLDRPQRERIRALESVVPQPLRVERLVPNDRDEAMAFFEEALERGHEGLMAKALDSPYEAGRRGAAWLKLKPAHTLDLVVLAAEWGSGRRQGWLSNLHLGARDSSTGGFVMLGKTFKGMTDAILESQTKHLLQREVSRDAYTVYVRPELVVEVAFDGLQESSQYPGGLALRFARIKRYRADKTPDEADTIQTIRDIHSGKTARRA